MKPARTPMRTLWHALWPLLVIGAALCGVVVVALSLGGGK